MRVLWLTGRELEYPRNDVLLRAFRRLGHVDVVSNFKTHPGSLIFRILYIYIKSLLYILTKKYDLIFIGFFGHLLVPPIRIVSKQPILFDAFISIFDTLCFDRQYFKPKSIIGRLAFWLDREACLKATHVLLDTKSHVDYFQQTLQLHSTNFSVIPVGCNETLFFPRSDPSNEYTVVLYYCTYQPLHGVDTVIRAASLLVSETDIHFRLIGRGQTYQQTRFLAAEFELKNLAFLPSVPLNSLPVEIASADICLGGPFGLSNKANRVIPGKIYQILSMKKPLIATRTEANLELLSHGYNAYLCSLGDPESLATAIKYLHENPILRDKLSANGYDTYRQQCSEALITQKIHDALNKTIVL
jgi:glycosyltransferase involved in cell wall biosynthesis